MKRVLVAIDARQVNVKVLDFACYIARLTQSNLTGIFLDNSQLHEMVMAGLAHRGAKEKLLDENIHLFREACSNRETNCSVYYGSQTPAADIIKESRFAELLIVDPEMSFKNKVEENPSGFIKDVLAKCECPVVLAPFDCDAIDEILFAYDGSAASVYAIKQFTYLFPELTGKKMTVLQVTEPGNNLFSEKGKIEELLLLHYPDLEFQLRQGKAADELFAYLLGKKNVFVVMGAFGRNMLSGFFRHSTAELIIKTINVPVFIAHHK